MLDGQPLQNLAAIWHYKTTGLPGKRANLLLCVNSFLITCVILVKIVQKQN